MIAIRFLPEIFATISQEAQRNSRSFAEQALIYIGRGMAVPKPSAPPCAAAHNSGEGDSDCGGADTR